MMNTAAKSTEQVWQDLSTELRNFIAAKVNDPYLAEDILQDVFLKVHLNLATLKDQNRLKSWVYQIARNSVQDYFRRKRFSLGLDAVDLADREQKKGVDPFVACMTPFIDKLPVKYREALVLADLGGMSQTQLARKLEITHSGAKSRVQRARQLLHSYLTECCDIISDKYGNIVSHHPKDHCLCEA